MTQFSYWITIPALVCVTLLRLPVEAGEQTWSLSRCIDYAHENNISVTKSKLDNTLSTETYHQARAAQLPEVNMSTQYSVSSAANERILGTSQSSDVSQSVRFSVNSSVTLFKGFNLRNNVKQKQLKCQTSEYTVSEIENNITISVTAAYLQVLYTHEAAEQALRTLESSFLQLEYAEQLLSAGSASRVDLAQVQSQYAQDKYDKIIAENKRDKAILAFKQLLELPPDTDFHPHYPPLGDSIALPEIPSLDEVYSAAEKTMPQIEAGHLNIQIAEFEEKKALSGYAPSVTATGGISSSHSSTSDNRFSQQFGDNLDPTLGVQLSIPLYDRRKTKTAHVQAKTTTTQAHLNFKTEKKNLLQSVETAWHNAQASRNKLTASSERLDARNISYELAQQQYTLGMLKPTELIIEKNKFLSAKNEHLQSKYEVILDYYIIRFYQGITDNTFLNQWFSP